MGSVVVKARDLLLSTLRQDWRALDLATRSHNGIRKKTTDQPHFCIGKPLFFFRGRHPHRFHSGVRRYTARDGGEHEAPRHQDANAGSSWATYLYVCIDTPWRRRGSSSSFFFLLFFIVRLALFFFLWWRLCAVYTHVAAIVWPTWREEWARRRRERKKKKRQASDPIPFCSKTRRPLCARPSSPLERAQPAVYGEEQLLMMMRSALPTWLELYMCAAASNNVYSTTPQLREKSRQWTDIVPSFWTF